MPPLPSDARLNSSHFKIHYPEQEDLQDDNNEDDPDNEDSDDDPSNPSELSDSEASDSPSLNSNNNPSLKSDNSPQLSDKLHKLFERLDPLQAEKEAAMAMQLVRINKVFGEKAGRGARTKG